MVKPFSRLAAVTITKPMVALLVPMFVLSNVPRHAKELPATHPVHHVPTVTIRAKEAATLLVIRPVKEALKEVLPGAAVVVQLVLKRVLMIANMGV